MIESSEPRQRMVRYLLGELPEEERAAFEAQYAADRDLFEELVDVENALVDRYATESLTEAERKQFESYYLATPQRRQRAELAKSLARHLSRSQTRDGAALKALHSFRPNIRMVSVLGLCAVLIAGLGFFLNTNHRLRQRVAEMQAVQADLQKTQNTLRQQVATLTEQLKRISSANTDATHSHGPAEIAMLTLSPGLARSGEDENRLVILPGITRRARLRLKLDQREYSLYAISLHTAEDVSLWRRNSLRSRMTPEHSRIVVADLPASLLKSGDYILKLSGITREGKEETVDEYIFTAVSR